MAAIVTRCTCGCEIRLETDQPKLFINNRTCHMCKSPVKFKQNQVDKFEEALTARAKEAEYMKTPWFAGSYLYDNCRPEIMKRLNSKEFLSSGKEYYEGMFS